MRAAARLLASVQRPTQFLKAGDPTGLTGLPTHASPRSALLYLYNSTLEKLKSFPEHSVYRQSTEALTRHRLSIVENVRPAGLAEWQQRAHAALEQFPQAFRKIPVSSGGADYNIVWKQSASDAAERLLDEESDADYRTAPSLEGIRSEDERADQGRLLSRDIIGEKRAIPRIELEPLLTTEQIQDIETRIGAGLIEEVIQVAEGEDILAGTLLESQVWEDLEEKPQEGQWTYHERGSKAA